LIITLEDSEEVFKRVGLSNNEQRERAPTQRQSTGARAAIILHKESTSSRIETEFAYKTVDRHSESAVRTKLFTA